MSTFFSFVTHHLFLWVAFIAVFIAVLVYEIRLSLSSIRTVSPQQLVQLINRENALLIDIRSKQEFDTAHITQSRSIPFDQLSTQIDKLKNEKNRPTVCICQHGMTSKRAAILLAKQGFDQVSVLQGGLAAWKQQSLPLESA